LQRGKFIFDWINNKDIITVPETVRSPRNNGRAVQHLLPRSCLSIYGEENIQYF
jgi:hypothetical protein